MKTEDDLRPAPCPTCGGPTFAYVLERRRDEAQGLLSLIADFVDGDDCTFDHHGGCQTHGWFRAVECPHARAKRLFLVGDSLAWP